jgi:hypothetical protein
MRCRSLDIALALGIVFNCSPASGQVKPTSEPAKTPHFSQTRDLTGVWMRDAPASTTQRYESLQYWVYEFNVEEPPMTAWAEAEYKAAKPANGPHPVLLSETNDPVYRSCVPPGVPRIFLQPTPLQIAQLPGEILILFEYDSLRRQIFTDGRPHDTTLGPSWMGDSIGHWDGNTLIVDTVNFNDKTWLDRVGHPHSDALHIVERIRRIDHDRLQVDITIEDPKAYTKPWTARLDYVLKATWTLAERFCEEDAGFLDVEKKETTPDK